MQAARGPGERHQAQDFGTSRDHIWLHQPLDYPEDKLKLTKPDWSGWRATRSCSSLRLPALDLRTTRSGWPKQITVCHAARSHVRQTASRFSTLPSGDGGCRRRRSGRSDVQAVVFSGDRADRAGGTRQSRSRGRRRGTDPGSVPRVSAAPTCTIRQPAMFSTGGCWVTSLAVPGRTGSRWWSNPIALSCAG